MSPETFNQVKELVVLGAVALGSALGSSIGAFKMVSTWNRNLRPKVEAALRSYVSALKEPPPADELKQLRDEVAMLHRELDLHGKTPPEGTRIPRR